MVNKAIQHLAIALKDVGYLWQLNATYISDVLAEEIGILATVTPENHVQLFKPVMPNLRNCMLLAEKKDCTNVAGCIGLAMILIVCEYPAAADYLK